MRLKVNANRMEFLKLRRKLAIAVRGHKLLKEKQDGLAREYQLVSRQLKEKEKTVHDGLAAYYRSFTEAQMSMTPEAIENAFLLERQSFTLESCLENKMGVKIPRFAVKFGSVRESYGYLETSGELDRSVEILQALLPELIEFAALKKSADLIQSELQRTRRRVNALEYVLIPNLEETVHYVSMKLGEAERSSAVRLMRIKEIVRK